jgi:hypothetical protein
MLEKCFCVGAGDLKSLFSSQNLFMSFMRLSIVKETVLLCL